VTIKPRCHHTCVSVQSGRRNDASAFHMCFCYYLFPQSCHTCHPPPHPTLSSMVYSFLFFFIFYHCYYPRAPDYSMQCLYLIRNNTNSSMLSITFNKCIFHLYHIFESLNALCGNTGPGPMQRHIHLNGLVHATDSLCGNRHCRWAHMQGIPPLRSLFHLRPRSPLPPRRAL
jgi:hypothetical protein